MADWLARTFGFVENGRSGNTADVVTDVEMSAGATDLLLERGDLQPDACPRDTRWTGVWVDDPDECFRQLSAMNIDATPPQDEPWGVRLVRVVDPEGHMWALMRRA